MLIDTHRFEIGDEVWWFDTTYGRTMNTFTKILKHNKIDCFHFYNTGLFVLLNDFCETSVHIRDCFHTEQQAIDYCNHMNGELC